MVWWFSGLEQFRKFSEFRWFIDTGGWYWMFAHLHTLGWVVGGAASRRASSVLVLVARVYGIVVNVERQHGQH